MKPADARKLAASALSRFSPDQIAAAARATGISVGMGGRLRRLLDAYPDSQALATAVLKGDKSLDKIDAALLKTKAIVLLSHLDAEAAVPLAAALLDDEDKAWCTSAADALAAIPTDAALDALFAKAADRGKPKPQGWVTAGIALGRAAHPATGQRALAQLEEVAAAGEDALRVRTDLMNVVAGQQHEPGRPLLEKLQREAKDPSIRDAASRALARYLSPEVLAANADKLEDPIDDVRMLAVRSLLRLDAKRAYDRLAPYFETDSPTSRTAILALAGDRGAVSSDGRWKGLFERLVARHDSWHFFIAWQLLADLGDVRGDVILAMLRDHPERVQELAPCLFRLPSSAVPVIEAELARREAEDSGMPDEYGAREAARGTLRNVIAHLNSKN